MTMGSNKSQEWRATWHNLSETNDHNKPRHEMQQQEKEGRREKEREKGSLEQSRGMGIRIQIGLGIGIGLRRRSEAVVVSLEFKDGGPCGGGVAAWRASLKRLLLKRIFISISFGIARRNDRTTYQGDANDGKRRLDGFGGWNGKWNQLLNFPQSRRSDLRRK